MDCSLMRQFSAMDASTANSTAFRFSTGNAPGKPRHTGQVLVLGGSPKRVEQAQKILLSVSNWTWTSSPITGSYFDSAAADEFVAVAIGMIISTTKMRAWSRPPCLRVRRMREILLHRNLEEPKFLAFAGAHPRDKKTRPGQRVL